MPKSTRRLYNDFATTMTSQANAVEVHALMMTKRNSLNALPAETAVISRTSVSVTMISTWSMEYVYRHVISSLRSCGF